jgi:YggT family protein
MALIVGLFFYYLAMAITIATFVMAGLLVLRMIMQWAQVNPFGWFALNVRRVTEPVMRPFRYGFDNRTLRIDFMPLVAAALVLMNGLFAAYIVGQFGVVADALLSVPVRVGRALGALVWLAAVCYMGLLLVRFLMPMLGVGYSNRFFRFAYQLTEPLLKPLRRYLIVGAFDLSPMVLLIVLQLVGGLVRDWLSQW